MICSAAPAKVILFGEHFVVKDKPAIVTAVNLYAKTCITELESEKHLLISKQLRLETDIDKDRVPEQLAQFKHIYEIINDKYGITRGFKAFIDSDIPVSSGMGSSAATAVSFTYSLLRFLGVEFELEDINNIAYEAEKLVHGKPSGIDNTVSTYGGIIYYKRGYMEKLNVKWPQNLSLVVVDSGIKRNTGKVVMDVLERYERHKEIMKHIYDAAEQLVNKARNLILSGRFYDLGELISINQGLLESIGVSIYETDKIIYAMIENGALGAKISGAGRGGIVYGLFMENNLNKAIHKLKNIGYKPIIVKPVEKGVIELQDSLMNIHY
ncbi:mevalonate kinase [Staphylothermus marinus F1]|uniref:Mevalonate kinase n=1 Tax=Staphylothermus marinus (strain ATCC 43588 / DSM 3639 / JCM 9404 / F1) TaxID=399550 RepID=A3DL21_STAMF|nr:mevalonate kinase [Staphylothermus marinus]ABN69331.1 mevalonate kinase [Staphylothermus marinus F1]